MLVTIVTNAEEDGLNKELNKTNNDSKTKILNTRVSGEGLSSETDGHTDNPPEDSRLKCSKSKL